MKNLLNKLASNGYDSFITFNLKNIRYLTGFSGTSGGVCVASGKATFLTDFRYASQVKKQVDSMRKVITSNMKADIAEILRGGKATETGYEDRNITVSEFNKLKKNIKTKWKPCHMVEELRLYKDKDEISIIEKNMKVLSKVFDTVPEIIKPGVSEKQISAELEYRLKLGGADGIAFDFIVASGKRSSLPHGVASNKKIGKNDFITLDWGALLDGYHTDNTRNFSIGRPKPKMKKIFDTVLEANQRAMEMIKPGVELRKIDSAARNFINSKGFGHCFGHGTGHGIGLDIHENPPVNQKSDQEAKEGMVFTIEPGIYLPDIGGVRIEDMVLVTQNGYRLLSKKLSRELVII